MSTPKETTSPELQFPTLEAFVEEFVAVVFDRTISPTQTCWCPQWWKHAEAVFDLIALWQSFEHMHVNDGPTWSARWLTLFAYPIMDRLTSPAGTFRACSPAKGHNTQPDNPGGHLPCDKADEGLFTPR